MLDLFKSEFARFRLFAWLFCAAQVMAWIMVGKITEILQPGSSKNVLMMLSVVFAGAAFALLTMTLHKRKSHWAYLVHRPMPIDKIHLAVSLAALALLFIGFVLPFTLTLLYLDMFTENVVEMRHYLYCVHMMLVAAMAYFCGSFAVLTPSKGAYLAIWSVTFLILRQSTPVYFDLLIDVVFVAVGYYLARYAFKIDLSTFNERKLGIVFSALVLQPAIIVALVLSQGIYYHIPLMAMGAHPDDDSSRNAFHTYRGKETLEQFSQLLAQSQHPKAAQLKRQLALAEFERLATRNQMPSLKHQLFVKDNDYAVAQAKEGIIWVFSHKDMVYVGRDMINEQFRGYLGVRGFIADGKALEAADRFTRIPRIFGANLIAAGNQLLEVDFKRKALFVRHQLEAGDLYVATPVAAFDKIWLKSQKALYILDQTDFTKSSDTLTADYMYPHPVDTKVDVGIDFTEVPDGYLVLYGSRNFNGYAKGGATLVFIPHESKPAGLATVAFNRQQVPDWIYFQKFIFSPIFNNLVEGTIGTILQFRPLPPEGERYFWQQKLNVGVYWFTVLLALLSAVATWLLSARREISKSNRLLWTVLNLVLSLPGLISFVLLTTSAQSAKGARN